MPIALKIVLLIVVGIYTVSWWIRYFKDRGSDDADYKTIENKTK